MKRDTLGALALALFSLAGFAYTFTLKRPSQYRIEGSIAGDVWPRILLGGIFVLSLVLLAQEILKARAAKAGAAPDAVASEVLVPQAETEADPAVQRAAFRNLYMFMGSLGLYAVFTPIIGFVLSTYLVQVAALWILNTRSKRVLWGVPFVVTFTVYGIFVRLLGMMLPRGVGPFLMFNRLLY